MPNFKIKVNHQDLSDAAKKAKSFVSLNKRSIRQITLKLPYIAAYWYGDGSVAFVDQWNDLCSSYSVNGKLNTAMEKYGRCLEVAAEKYKKAQIDAINRANRLR